MRVFLGQLNPPFSQCQKLAGEVHACLDIAGEILQAVSEEVPANFVHTIQDGQDAAKYIIRSGLNITLVLG